MDLNVMLREQARSGLQAQLNTAVTNGDTEAALKVTAELEKLAAAGAPKAPPYGDVEIKAHLEKTAWFGTDPKKTAMALQFGKDLNIAKFPTAEAFATALIKAVEDEFKPAGTTAKPNELKDDDGNLVNEDGELIDDEGNVLDDEAIAALKAKNADRGKSVRRSDGPGVNDGGVHNPNPGRRGPWTKLSEAPREVQTEVKRQADKFIPNATKEEREKFITNSLSSHYAQHQRNRAAKR